MIAFNNVTKQYGGQILFVDASFQVNPGEKVGLVGPNGAGKTTIFRLLMGAEVPDEGTVEKPRRLTLGYFDQHVGDLRGRSVLPMIASRLRSSAPTSSAALVPPCTAMMAMRPSSAMHSTSRAT